MLFRILFLLVGVLLSFNVRASFHQEPSDVFSLVHGVHRHADTAARNLWTGVCTDLRHCDHPQRHKRYYKRIRFMAGSDRGVELPAAQGETRPVVFVPQSRTSIQVVEAYQAELRQAEGHARRSLSMPPPVTPTGARLKSAYLPKTRFV